ncbi:MAG TPA: O-antigen ligase family protein [Puia sp.]|nr:O-antigen ligase family protein [Puia sp.]
MSRKHLYLYLTFAVLATTVFSWFRINSLCIILLAAYKLWENKPLPAVKAAFTNKFVIAYLVFFLVEAVGLLHTHNMKAGGDALSKDATLVAIAFTLCAGTFVDERGYKQVMTGYCGILLAASLYCLVVATRNYLSTRDIAVFFYHPLTACISQNAVFYSVYVLFGALYLLTPGGILILPESWKAVRRPLQICLVVFFGGMIVLLSSKLILVIFLIIVIVSLTKNYSARRDWKLLLVVAIIAFALTGVLAVTNNPIKSRFQELMAGDLELVKKDRFAPGDSFNALQIRMLELRFAWAILNEQHAWLFGVTPGDSQDLLDRKYINANMYIGNPADGPHRKIRGFIGYNFHNQYVETLVRDGILGLAALLAIFWLLAGMVWKWKTRLAFFTVLTLFVFFIPEAPLTMQQGIFLFCFFPLFLLHSPKRTD